MKTRVVAVCCCLLAGAVLAPAGESAGAAHGRPRRGSMSVSMEVLVGGQLQPTVEFQGKTYLPVLYMGMEYEVRVRNHGHWRITAVLAVDGLSVRTGEPASEADPGYIVDPGDEVVIKGWRRSLSRVAAFRFVDPQESYARLTGRSNQIGVIRLVCFEEQVRRRQRKPALLGKGGRSRGGRGGGAVSRGGVSRGRAASAGGGVGTAYGREVESSVRLVRFRRSSNKQTITLIYDTAPALRRAGVAVPRLLPSRRQARFALPPPGYKGR
jgi:hypothetical protein